MKIDFKTVLPSIWVFAVLNYLYCDVLGLMDTELLKQYLTGTVNGMTVTQGFLLSASFLMEIPIAMVLLSRLLPRQANRIANFVAGGIMSAVQTATLFVAPTPYYIFFSIFEIAATLSVIVAALFWKKSASETA